jgi:hypothetical protein
VKTIGLRIVLNLTFCSVATSLIANEIQLPEIGADVNYDYSTATPQFVVGTHLPSDQLVHSKITFAENKDLFFEFVPQTPGGQPEIQMDLEFRGSGFRAVFDPIYISFDEQLSLLVEHGQQTPPATNTGIDYYDSDPDIYSFSWSLFPESDFALRGLQWAITPDLVAGAALPETVDIWVDFFAAGRIIVVPEPGGALGILILTAACFPSRRKILRAR